MFSERVSNCFDSHVHWLHTGEIDERLDLSQLAEATEVKQLHPDPHHYRGEWLIGFGWDQNRWPGGQFPTRQILDEAFPTQQPVAFSRADGHALWVNSEALKRAGLLSASGQEALPVTEPKGAKILRDERGLPTGVLLDTASSLVDPLIPQASVADLRRSLLRGMQIFNEAGITHIRDMSCSPMQWEQSIKLEASGILTLAVEQYFSADDPRDFLQALDLAKFARQVPSRLLRAKGLKIYFDGALGSEGALLSQAYASGSGRGLQLMEIPYLKDCMRVAWREGFDLAVHTIGDEAAHQVVLAAREVWQEGVSGRLHLEHAEILRPDTIEKMRGQTVTCHLQPCHWLSDRLWLKNKIPDLARYAFPWRALQEAEVDFFFGSDSPIEEPRLVDNWRALQESAAEGVPKLLGDPLVRQSHPDLAWVPNTFTVFEEGQPSQVVFAGEHLA